MIYIYEQPIFTVNNRYDMIGSIKNWEKALYQDVVVNGMGLEATKEKHKYSSYKKWGQKRFDKVYASYIEMYNARTGNDDTGKSITKSKQMVYILIALAVGLGIAFIFIHLFKGEK